MTLDRHRIDGVAPITARVLPAQVFDEQLIYAGYTKAGSAPAQGNRLKVWWVHAEYARVEAIYSPDGAISITAYHVAIQVRALTQSVGDLSAQGFYNFVGERAIALNLLEQGISIGVIAQATGIAMAQLQQLQTKSE